MELYIDATAFEDLGLWVRIISFTKLDEKHRAHGEWSLFIRFTISVNHRTGESLSTLLYMNLTSSKMIRCTFYIG